MYGGASVHVVKLVSSIVFLIQPLSISFIAHRWYKINRKVEVDKNAIPQKWNGLAQHISAVVLQSSGITVLTFFSTLENVSVYAIYFLVVNGVRNLTMAVTNGVQAFLGNLFAKGDVKTFEINFESFEFRMHFFVTLVFSITAVLVVPFVGVYTKGVTDVNYITPAFGILLTAGWGMYCLRLPYNIVVLAVGHYRQTQNSAIIEAVLNLVTGCILLFCYGLVGVAIGTLIAMVYRTSYLAWYISKNVLHRSLWIFVKHLFVDAIAIISFMAIIYVLGEPFTKACSSNYVEWVVSAVKASLIGILVVTIVNAVFFHHEISRLINRKKLKNCNPPGK